MCTLVKDKYYYIKDYSGNFYRINSDNQLVVASNEKEAAVFSYTEASERIGLGQKSKFFCIRPIDGSETAEEHAVSTVKELTVGELADIPEMCISEFDMSKIDWDEYLTHFIFIVSNLKEYREQLSNAESDADQKISDILHYIELCDTDDNQAADLIELLKVCREKRRDIKNEDAKVLNFQNNIGTSANLAKAKQALKAIKGLEKRKYAPRKFAELFEGCELKLRPREERCINLMPEEPVEEFVEEYDEGYYEEESQMEKIRRETAFDGKKHDWLQFAKQQAEFYNNVNQYITNIELDIDEIEDKIEELMELIEVSNCNVTQGYRMFKNLKDLRLEKKAKEQELECLYIMTDHFDVAAIADECQKNVEEMNAYLYGEEEEVENVIAEIAG